MASQRKIERNTGTLTTTDATITTIVTYAIPSGSSGHFEANVVGRDTSNGDTVAAVKRTSGKNIAGTASMVGSVFDVVTLTSDVLLATAVVTITVSGGNLLVRVTGVAAKTLDWHCELTAWLT